MKKILLLAAFYFLYSAGHTQLYIGTNSQFTVKGAVVLTLQDADLLNNGLLRADSGTFRFTGISNSLLGGDSISTFRSIELEKSGNAKISLGRNLRIQKELYFGSGLFDLNGHNLYLDSTAVLQNENASSRITGENGGYIEIIRFLHAPAGIQPGHLGLSLDLPAWQGWITLRRNHQALSGNGMPASIRRNYEIITENSTGTNGHLKFFYFSSELNGLNEALLTTFKNTGGQQWQSQSGSLINMAQQYLELPVTNSAGLYAFAQAGALPVTGLEFEAERKDAKQVELNWITIQEINNRGFYVERRKENETGFSVQAFIPAQTADGNSPSPQQYHFTDLNEYSGNSYYRLRQEDRDNRISYSPVRLVLGLENQEPLLKVWPVPAIGPVNIRLRESARPDQLSIFTLQGKCIRRLILQPGQPIQVNGLLPGTYFLQLANQPVSQKIMIQ